MRDKREQEKKKKNGEMREEIERIERQKENGKQPELKIERNQ
jgi:hypothetical protein